MIEVSRATVIAAYELLRSVPPFRGWKLPDPSEVDFDILHSKELYGDCDGDTIRVSKAKHGHLQTLLMTVAHECIHLHQMRRGLETSNTEHNHDFRKRAERVCRIHGWDEKIF